ncbi:MAG: hypothetical protein CL930_10800 [Deltaproteobacteria bacterium]|nr:hypothetical protein [Deltaproteobacteria bacterium]
MIRGIFLALALSGCGDEKVPTALDGEQCVSCHDGVEAIHPNGGIPANDCVICHGGDGDATTLEEAHVAVPGDWEEIRGTGLASAPHGFIKDMAPDQLDRLDPDYLQFINPGDIRVADKTCGRCHNSPVDYVANVRNSVMTTNTGHYMPTRFLAGLQGRDAIYGSYAATDPHHDPSNPHTVPSVTQLRPAKKEEIEAALEAGDTELLNEMAYDHYLSKSCNTCHAAGYPRNNSPHLYRSTGCTACHMVYNKDGVYEGEDEAISTAFPVYPAKHEITTAIPTEQCATCHFQGGRIGLLFRGIREGGFAEVPPHAEVWAESAYGHTAGYYILDEDTTNDVDETPPDLHYAAGMECADCHVGTDVHGDGRIYSTEKHQVDIRCEDCHGNSRQRVLPAADGAYYTASGRKLPQLTTGADGEVILIGSMDEKEHTVPQPADILASGHASEAMQAAMGPNSEDWCHPDSLTCDSCHNSHQQFCIGCHVSVDTRLSQVDYQTGERTVGLTRGSRDTWSLDHLLLAQGVDGRAQATMPSQQVQMSLIDFAGELLLGGVIDEDTAAESKELGAFRESSHGRANVGFAPFFQHTSSAKPRSCDTCHRTDTSEEELRRVKGVYGFGTGEFMLDNPHGEPVDALQFLDADGNPITDWVHTGTGPLGAEVRDRALGVILEEEK